MVSFLCDVPLLTPRFRLFKCKSVDAPVKAIVMTDDEIVPFANGKVDMFDDPIPIALEFLREQIGLKDPYLDFRMAEPAHPIGDATGQPTEAEIYGFGVLQLEGDGWKVKGKARKNLLNILGKAERDVVEVYLSE